MLVGDPIAATYRTNLIEDVIVNNNRSNRNRDIRVRMDQATIESLNDVAKAAGISRSDVVRLAIRNVVELSERNGGLDFSPQSKVA